MNFYPFNYERGEVKTKDRLCVIRVESSYKGGYFCGYVVFKNDEIPESWIGNYDASGLQYLNVHGGLTYAKQEGDWSVFGFDCAHAHDDEDVKLQDADYVMSLVEQMESQMKVLATKHRDFLKADKEGKIKILDEIREQGEIKEQLGFGGLLQAFSGTKDLDKPK